MPILRETLSMVLDLDFSSAWIAVKRVARHLPSVVQVGPAIRTVEMAPVWYRSANGRIFYTHTNCSARLRLARFPVTRLLNQIRIAQFMNASQHVQPGKSASASG